MVDCVEFDVDAVELELVDDIIVAVLNCNRGCRKITFPELFPLFCVDGIAGFPLVEWKIDLQNSLCCSFLLFFLSPFNLLSSSSVSSEKVRRKR